LFCTAAYLAGALGVDDRLRAAAEQVRAALGRESSKPAQRRDPRDRLQWLLGLLPMAYSLGTKRVEDAAPSAKTARARMHRQRARALENELHDRGGRGLL
jgi:hypothetical protein